MLLLLFAALLLASANSQASSELETAPPAEPVWMNWKADQFSLADDGESIWIGASGSVLQWDKDTGTTWRYGPTVGLYHRQVLAVAIDGAGNRWFGGDAGLSRLDPGGEWTHYAPENSELPFERIDGIAVGTDGTLWLSHGLPDGSVSQLNPDGTWNLYPNRQTAVIQAYELVKGTVNANDLWTVAGNEVWVGYDVFDGLSWENRIPPDANDLTLAVRSDSGGDIWVLGGNNVFGDGSIVYGWNVSTWSTYRIWFPFDGFATTLAVGPDDSVWVGWEERYSLPYTNRTAGISRLPEEPGYVDLQQPLYVPGPVVSLLPTSEGMWGIGPGWLLQPDETVSFIEDVPRFEDVTEVVMTAEKQLFVHSVYQAPYTWGGIQTIDDQGTTRLNDDVWGYSTDLDILTAAEPVPDGDLWVAGYKYLRVGYPMGPLRYHQGGWLPYKEFFATDIFAEDARHTWFGYYEGVFRLDDGGTPSNYDDDVWTDYPTGSNRVKSAVAVDALGQLWYGSESGLYRYNGAAWEPVNLERAVCDMVPAADGTLFVQRAEDCSDLLDSSFNLVLIVRPDGGQEIKQVDELVEEEFDRVRTASHRNRLWTVAPDGAISYPLRRNSDLRIERYDGLILTSNHLPFHKSLYAGETLEIDEDNHLWLVGDRQLWRLSLPDFQLDQQFWLLVPGSSRQRTISVHAIAGYSGSVLLDVTGLPIGVTATFETNPVQAGEATQLTLTADAGVALGTNNATLGGTDGVITHTVPFTLKLVAVVYEFYAPLVTVYD